VPTVPLPTTQIAAVGEDEDDEIKLIVALLQLREIGFGEAVVKSDEPKFNVGDTEVDNNRLGLSKDPA